MRYIGVAPYLLDISEFKRAALLFDAIGQSGLDDFLVRPYLEPERRSNLAWLVAQQIVIPVEKPAEPATDPEVIKWENEDARRLATRAAETSRFQKIEHEVKLLETEVKKWEAAVLEKALSKQETSRRLGKLDHAVTKWRAAIKKYTAATDQYIGNFSAANYARGRVIAAGLNRDQNTRAAVVTPGAGTSVRAAGGKDVVLSVILKELPVPDDRTAWEAVAEFREDPDASRKRARLHNWAKTLAKTNITASEVGDEIEAAMSEYTEHMRLHKIKSKRTTAEIVVVGAATLIEDMAKFRFGELAKRIFEMRKRKTELLLAEASAPGRAVAYVVEARNRFTRRTY